MKITRLGLTPHKMNPNLCEIKYSIIRKLLGDSEIGNKVRRLDGAVGIPTSLRGGLKNSGEPVEFRRGDGNVFRNSRRVR